jgi:hypothetical protein
MRLECERTAPIAMLELSASSLNGKSSFGRIKTGAEVTSSLSFMKESSWGKPQMNLMSFMVKSNSESCGYKCIHISNPSLLLLTTIYLHFHPSPCLSIYQTFLLKTSPLLPLPWRLPEEPMRRENVRRQRNGKDSRRRSMSVRRQQCGERGRAEGGGSVESGGGTEGSPGSRESGMGSSSSGRTMAVACNRAFRPQTHHPGTCQYRVDDIRFIYSMGRGRTEEEGDGRGAIHVSVL